MSPSGLGRRSTDPRIHCRHRTHRDGEIVRHDARVNKETSDKQLHELEGRMVDAKVKM